mmetsp:Transcript_8947/g.22017  ORF Transcript_8947/g.22017 Transcript_8947/m.22017 type:complete len:1410 (-) Transcript_8947:337-4566(-)
MRPTMEDCTKNLHRIALLLFLPLLCSESAKGDSCRQLNVSGSKSFPELMGTYKMDPTEGKTRPEYQLIKQDMKGFIFHSNGAWYIGTNSTSWDTVCAIAVRDDALSPEKVEHVWQELGPYSRRWHGDPSIQVSCSSPEKACTSSNGLQSRVNVQGGECELDLESENSAEATPIDWEASSKVSASDEIGDHASIEIVRDALEKEAGDVPFSPALSDFLNGSEENTTSGYSAKSSLGNCAGIWIRGSVLHKDLMGIYRHTNHLEDGRPTFRRRIRRSKGSRSKIRAGLLELAYYDQTPRGFWGVARGEDEYLPLHKLDSTGTLAGLTAQSRGDGSVSEQPGGGASSAWLEYAVEHRLLLPNPRVTASCVSEAELKAAEESATLAGSPQSNQTEGREEKDIRTHHGGLVPYVEQLEVEELEFDENDLEKCDICEVFVERYAGYENFDEFLETHAPSLFQSGSIEDLVAFSDVMGEVSAPVVKLVMLGFDTGLWRRALNISRDELVAGYDFSAAQIDYIWEMSWRLGIRQAHAVELLDIALEPLPVLQESWAPILALIALQQLDYYDLAPDLLHLDLNDVDIRWCVIRMLWALGVDAVAPIRWFARDHNLVDHSLLQLLEDIGREGDENARVLCTEALIDIMHSISRKVAPVLLIHLLRLHGVDADAVNLVLRAASNEYVDDVVFTCEPPEYPLSLSTLRAARGALSNSHPVSVALGLLSRADCLRSDDGFSDSTGLLIAGTVLAILCYFTWCLATRHKISKRRKRSPAKVAAAAAAAAAATRVSNSSATFPRLRSSLPNWLSLVGFANVLKSVGLSAKSPHSNRTKKSNNQDTTKTNPSENENKDLQKENQRKKEKEKRRQEEERKRKKLEKRRAEKQKKKELARQREEVRRKNEQHREDERRRRLEQKRKEDEEQLRRAIEEENLREAQWRARRKKDEARRKEKAVKRQKAEEERRKREVAERKQRDALERQEKEAEEERKQTEEKNRSRISDPKAAPHTNKERRRQNRHKRRTEANASERRTGSSSSTSSSSQHTRSRQAKKYNRLKGQTPKRRNRRKLGNSTSVGSSPISVRSNASPTDPQNFTLWKSGVPSLAQGARSSMQGTPSPFSSDPLSNMHTFNDGHWVSPVRKDLWGGMGSQTDSQKLRKRTRDPLSADRLLLNIVDKEHQITRNFGQRNSTPRLDAQPDRTKAIEEEEKQRQKNREKSSPSQRESKPFNGLSPPHKTPLPYLGMVSMEGERPSPELGRPKNSWSSLLSTPCVPNENIYVTSPKPDMPDPSPVGFVGDGRTVSRELSSAPKLRLKLDIDTSSIVRNGTSSNHFDTHWNSRWKRSSEQKPPLGTMPIHQLIAMRAPISNFAEPTTTSKTNSQDVSIIEKKSEGPTTEKKSEGSTIMSEPNLTSDELPSILKAK